ncbi:MAG: hypothetical protein RMJ43_16380 [Chloroherpetonaceae bacterium]|nr:hypothetical protein [Chthonomonadaceae bacterium]MDW8209409.1 hypothetical protein [Chloroherpetonaceae bacterium]
MAPSNYGMPLTALSCGIWADTQVQSILLRFLQTAKYWHQAVRIALLVCGMSRTERQTDPPVRLHFSIASLSDPESFSAERSCTPL